MAPIVSSSMWDLYRSTNHLIQASRSDDPPRVDESVEETGRKFDTSPMLLLHVVISWINE